MGPGAIKLESTDLDAIVEAFEEAHVTQGQADLAAFLPAAADPLCAVALRELIRVDMEYSWQRGVPRRLQYYLERFPQLAQDPAGLHEVAFEEYRLRQQAGEDVGRADYQQQYGIDTGPWPMSVRTALERPPSRSDPAAAQRLAEAADAMPAVGDAFAGFQLVDLLGTGAFGRVFLARQGDLADRLVALKVSTDLWRESQTLARLQHTHIVPVYSVHRAGPLQAVCMPYLGRTTLADVLQELPKLAALPRSGKALFSTVAQRLHSTVLSPSPGADAAKPAAVESPPAASADHAHRAVIAEFLEKKSYVDGVLWLGACLADGLAHAHERGIWHRDLKPANVLLTDEGQPMLLDFNLSEDSSLRGGAAGAFVGGTLPYMAPEHLAAFERGRETVDGRGDIYALGVMLFELLTGRQPFPLQRGVLAEVVTRMRADRGGPPPRLRGWNADISPAVEAIVRRCLEPDPQRRYPSARQLQEDIQRHLDRQPLRHTREPSWRERCRKWLARHPRLSVALALGSAAAVLVATLGTLYGVREYQVARLEAANAVMEAHAGLAAFRTDMRAAQLLVLDSAGNPAARQQALDDCRRTLARYRVLEDASWQQRPAVTQLPAVERAALREDVAELLLLLARATVPETAPGRAQLESALNLNHRAEHCFPANETPRAVWQQRANLLAVLGQTGEAEAARARAAATPVASARDRAFLASEELAQGNLQAAVALLEEAARQEPQRFTIWLDLGLRNDWLDRPADAAACYSTCIALTPQLAPLYVKRGAAYLRQGQPAKARADCHRALELQPNLAEAYLQRALAQAALKEFPKALNDLDRAAQHGAPPGRVWLMKARVHQLLGNGDAAQRDRDAGLKHVPADEAGWLARGIAEKDSDPKAALASFDQALQLQPRSRAALQSKASILSEKLGDAAPAIRLLDRVIELYPDYAPAWAGRGVLLARAGKRTEAHRDAQAALTADPAPRTLYMAANIYALTSPQEPDDRVHALHFLSRALRSGFGFEHLDTDRDLDALRDRPEFKQLVESVRRLGSP